MNKKRRVYIEVIILFTIAAVLVLSLFDRIGLI